MSITVNCPGKGQELAKRILFLAYQASSVCGMGLFQRKDSVTEEQVWGPAPDYCLDFNTRPGSKYCDYCFGRMMKVGVNFTNDSVTMGDYKPEFDYQSWAFTYPTVESLVKAAQESLGL